MNNPKFKELVMAIRRHWTSRYGAIAIVSRCCTAEDSIRICVGPIVNENEIVAVRCNAWRGEDLLYTGELMSVELRKILTKGRCVKACITDYRHVDDVHSQWKCYKPCSKRCQAKGVRDVERTAVQGS